MSMDSILIFVVFSSGFPEKSERVATFFKSVHFCVLIGAGDDVIAYDCSCSTTRGSRILPIRNMSISSSDRSRIDSKNVLCPLISL